MKKTLTFGLTIDELKNYYGDIDSKQEQIAQKALYDAEDLLLNNIDRQLLINDINNNNLTLSDRMILSKTIIMVAGWILDNGYFEKNSTSASFGGKSISQSFSEDYKISPTFFQNLETTKYYSSYDRLEYRTKCKDTSTAIPTDITTDIVNTISSNESISGIAETQYEVNLEDTEAIKSLESGTFNYPQITLNGETITTWPDGSGGSSSTVIDDSTTNPTEGINPWKTQIDTNTGDIADLNTDITNIETEISNITDGTTPIPQNTDNVVYTILGNSTTSALGDFNGADPRLYNESPNDTVVRDNTLLTITDNIQDEIDIINGDGSGSQAVIDELLPNQTPVIGTFDTNFNMRDYTLLFAGETESNGTIGEGLICGTDMTFGTNYLNGFNFASGDYEMYFNPNTDTNFTTTTTNPFFAGTSYLNGYNQAITPLLDQEGNYGRGDTITLNQPITNFDFLLIKTTYPTRDIYIFADVDLSYPNNNFLCDGADNSVTILRPQDDTNLRVDVSKDIVVDSYVKNIWGINFYSQTELLNQTFNPLDYDMFLITYNITGDYGARETGHFLSKNIIMDGTTIHSFTPINTSHTIRFTETGYIEETSIISMKGILFEERTTQDCRAKASVCDVKDIKTQIDTLNNLVQQSFNTFGSYNSPLGTATDQTIRPTLTANIPLDASYVEVDISPEPNNFINKEDGRIVFTIQLSNLTNEGADIANLGLNIWYNGELKEPVPNVDIPIGWSGSRTITGALSVEKDSTVYIEFVVSGTLSVDAPIQYNIEYNSENLVASPSSQVINDKATNPNLGINADLNLINTLQTQFNSLQNQVNSLMLPIGSIVLAPSSPTYGTWTYLGTLADGQTIIGGNSSDGMVGNHRHRWFVSSNSYGMDNNNGGNHAALKSIGTYDINGNIFRIADNSESVFGTDGYTENTGAAHNVPYGFGLGLGINIYRRVL